MFAGDALGLAWEPCRDQPSAECASLDVPLDRGALAAGSISLPLRRIRAGDPAQRIGVLLTLAGGPGQRGTEWVLPNGHPPSIRQHFDIVGFDPRGTSGETDITCIEQWDPYGSIDRTPDDASERAALDDRMRELAAGCRDEHASVLPHVGTRDTVLDVEALRRALGEAQLSLLGSSYGSEVALRYASAYPSRVRSVVLDGYSDPNAQPMDRLLEQAVAFERQLDELLIECALRTSCPLAAMGEPSAALDDLLATLDTRPMVAGDGRVLRQNDVYEAIAGALVGDRVERESLLGAIAAAVRGDARTLLDIAVTVRTRFEESGIDRGTFAAISCADEIDAWTALTDTDIQQLASALRHGAPRLGPWLWSPPAAEDLPARGLCAMAINDTRADPGPFDGAGAGPILVLGASGDPTTPLPAAERALGDLEDARLVAVHADQHLVYPYAVAAPDTVAHRCVLQVVEAYLLDGLAPPSGRCG